MTPQNTKATQNNSSKCVINLELEYNLKIDLEKGETLTNQL